MGVRASARTRHAGQAEHRDDVGVVPLERDGEGEHVEISHRRAATRRCAAAAGGELGLQLLPAGQEHALADDVAQLVEEPVHRLEAQVGHPDEVGIRERERDAQPPAVRFSDEADFAGENVVRAPVTRLCGHA